LREEEEEEEGARERERERDREGGEDERRRGEEAASDYSARAQGESPNLAAISRIIEDGRSDLSIDRRSRLPPLPTRRCVSRRARIIQRYELITSRGSHSAAIPRVFRMERSH